MTTMSWAIRGIYCAREGTRFFAAGSNNPYGDGTLNAVYGALEYLLSFRYYALDSYRLDRNVNKLHLLKFDVKDIPDFDRRQIGYGILRANPDYAKRMRVLNYAEAEGIIGGHCQYDLMSQYVNDKDKQDWFSEGSEVYAQFGLCYSNVEMREFFAELLKPYIERNPDAKVIHIGQPDTDGVCDCAACVEGRATKNMNSAGEQINFVNEIAAYLEPWLKENFPNNTFRFSCFAYHGTETPPVVYNEQTGKYEPFSEYVVPRDDVGVYWAPVNMDYSRSITDPDSINASSKTALDGWNDLLEGKEDIYMWSYATNMSNYMIPYTAFPLFSVKENYTYYKDHGVTFIFEQGPSDGESSTLTFEELKIYVMSRLMWDTDLNVNDLVEEFLTFYYGPAGQTMLEYYNVISAHYADLNNRYPASFFGSIFAVIWSEEYWPKGFVDSLDRIFDKAYEDISVLRESDPLSYGEYYDRISKLHLTVDYLNLEYYTAYYKPSDVRKMIDEFEKNCVRFNIYRRSEGNDVSGLIEKWTQKL